MAVPIRVILAAGYIYRHRYILRERERERESNAERLTGNPNHHVPTPTSSDGIERKSTNVGAANGELNFETNKSVSLDRWVKNYPSPRANDGEKRGNITDDRRNGLPGFVENMDEDKKWPTPTRPNEGNVRILRKKVLNGELTEEDARAMLNGKSPLEAQGKIPTTDNRQPTTDNRQPTTDNSPLLADAKHKIDVRWERQLESDEKAGRTRDDNGAGKKIHDGRQWWEVEPPIRRVVDGLAFRVDRLRCTGNGVVPQQAAVAWQKILDLAAGA